MYAYGITSNSGLPTRRQIVARVKTAQVKQGLHRSTMSGRVNVKYRKPHHGFTKSGYKLFEAASSRDQAIARGIGNKLLRVAFGRYSTGGKPQASRGVGIIKDTSLTVEMLAKLIGAHVESMLLDHLTHKAIVLVTGDAKRPSVTLTITGREPVVKKTSAYDIYGDSPRWRITV